ncbi:MAG: hypothetical protein BHV69_09385 [Bacteroidales bacterium 52_46]|nr:MAG: hypothetical protein BHV69_09385 [Bacteroidales bacterium 52_46]
MGYTEDLLNCVVRDIEQNWERKGGNISYFVGLVRGVRLTAKDLDRFLDEHGDTCHEGVNHVFAQIVYEDLLKNEEGGEA